MAKTPKIFSHFGGGTQVVGTYTVPSGKYAIANIVGNVDMEVRVNGTGVVTTGSGSAVVTINGMVLPAGTTLLISGGGAPARGIATGFEYDL